MKLIILLSLIMISSCNSGGGGSKSSGPVVVTPPPIDEPSVPVILPDIRPTCAQAAATTAAQGYPFHAKGRRTNDEYFLICNAAQLVAINSNDSFLSATFYLGDDIELGFYYTGITYESFPTPAGKPTNQFVIASNPNKPFTGLLFGDNYVISNFRYVNDNTTNLPYCGLFGYTDGASITLLQLENVRIDSGSGACAPLVGYAKNSYFNHIAIVPFETEGFNDNELLFVRGGMVAGLIARLENSTVSDGYSVASLETVSGSNDLLAGGLFIDVYNGSEINNVFYDGLMTLSEGTISGAISTYKPVDDELFEFNPTLFYNVWHSNSKGSVSACSDDALCASDQIFSVNTSNTSLAITEGGPYFFMYAYNEPLASWKRNYWWFIEDFQSEDVRYPWLD